MNELEELIAALGCENFAGAMAATTRFNAFLDDARRHTNAANTNDTISALRGQMAIVTRLESATGKSGVDALAQMEAWKAGADRVTEIEAQMKAQEKKQNDIESAVMLDKATSDGRLLPAKRADAESFYAEFGLSGLKTFLNSLPPSGIKVRQHSDGPAQPPPKNAEPRADADLTDEELRVGKALRKSKSNSLEARKLWDETDGVIDESHIEELNKKQLRAAAHPAGAGADR